MPAMVDKLTFIGGGDGLNAPRRLPAKRPDLPRVVQVPGQPVRRRSAASSIAIPLWLLLLAIVAFGSYFAWREADNRRIARGDLTDREWFENEQREDRRKLLDALQRAAESTKRTQGFR